jgi:hypothetical protein
MEPLPEPANPLDAAASPLPTLPLSGPTCPCGLGVYHPRDGTRLDPRRSFLGQRGSMVASEQNGVARVVLDVRGAYAQCQYTGGEDVCYE